MAAQNFTYPEVLWAGSEHSLTLAAEAHAQAMNAYAGLVAKQEEEEEEIPYMLSVQGNVGVISIRGSLVNRDSPWNRYFGVSSYADVRRAVVYAAENESIQGILLDIDSGGGAVNGVSDTADLIASVNKQIKPVWTYTEGTMASAAYWLGSSGEKVYSAKTAVTGSIGVICTHMEYSKQLKDEGVGVTVIRAGEYKALANSVEPLTEVAMKQLQDQLNSAYAVFIGHVAASRGVTTAVADQKMGQGREFFGESAVAAGLVDGIKSFDAVMGIFSKKLLDKSQVTQNNNGKYYKGTNTMKQALTEQQIAALASGATLDAVTAPAATAAAAAVQAETEAATAAAKLEADAAAAAAAVVTEAAAPAAAPAQDAVVALLKSQLNEAQAALVALTVEASATKAKLSTMETTFGALKDLAAASLSNMRVALGNPALDASAMSAETILADHASTSESFKKLFKVGGVAATTQAEEKVPAVIDPAFAARVAANRYTARK